MNKVEITVRAELENGEIKWNDDRVRFIPPTSGSKSGRVIHLTDPAEAELVFDLDDCTGLRLEFEELASDAIWIQRGTACPPGPGDGGGEFVIHRPQAGKLRVIDRHNTDHEYCYALRFTSQQGPQKFDPIIKN
jgi:hypothetical protein